MHWNVCLVKPVKEMFATTPKLDVNLLIENTNREIETSIIFDTNLLCVIEDVVKKGNKWKTIREYKLDKLVKLLNQPNTAISISAGTALVEMPPANREFSQHCYNEFLSKHAQQFVDDPRGVNDIPPKSSIKDWGFDELDIDAQKLLSLFYGSFLILQMVNREHLKPIDKYALYLQKVIEEFDMVSAPLSEIAKICFYNPAKNIGDDFKAFLSANISNFLKIPKKYYGKKLSTSEAIKKSAFNSALDIFIFHHKV